MVALTMRKMQAPNQLAAVLLVSGSPDENLPYTLMPPMRPTMLNQEGEDVNRTGLGVVPCIEINLRRTMGHVAIDLYEHLVANSSDEMKTNRTNIMRVEYDGNRYHLRIKPGRPSEEAPLH